MRVNNPGLTDLTADTDYLLAWRHCDAPPLCLMASLAGTVCFGSYAYFDNTNSNQNTNQTIHLFKTNLSYNFTNTGKISISETGPTAIRWRS